MKLSVEISSIPFSETMAETLKRAEKYAHLDKEPQIRTTHLTFAILNDDYENIVLTTLAAMKIDQNILSEMVEEKRKLNSQSIPFPSSAIELSKELEKILISSYKKVKTIKSEYDESDFFMAILRQKNELTEILDNNAIEYSVFKETYDEVSEFFNDLAMTDMVNESADVDFKSNVKIPNIKNPLSAFTISMNEEYRKGKLNQCIGREEEIETLERVLNRKNKRNLILVGAAGVGKTNIIEGLVEKIETGTSSVYLKNKIILALNINDLISGTTWRGQLEERIKGLIDFLKENKNYILFIDEIHTIMGAAGTSSVDFSDVLKPALSRGDIQVIGATTTEEYKIYLEKDRALARRFFLKFVEEPSSEETFLILKQIKKTYEKEHNVRFSDDVLRLIVDLSGKYGTNKSYPDKSIELMDDIGASIKVKRIVNKNIQELNKKLSDIQITKHNLFEKKQYERAETILLLERSTLLQLQKENQESNNNISAEKVTTDDVLHMAKKIYRIKEIKSNIINVSNDLEEAEQNILRKIKGQDNIVHNIMDKIKAKNLFKDLDGESEGGSMVFLFVGDTGVGKTYLAELLAEYLYDNKIKVINGEMFKERHAISNIIGSPKGYVGSEEGSDLFEYVKYNPQCVVLLDEIEKAHPDFYDTILTIIDKKKIPEKNGIVINFSDVLFIMTSNIGTKKAKSFLPIGFTTEAKSTTHIYENEIKSRFNPEFLNRLDEICYFNPMDNLSEILDGEMEKIKIYLKSKKILVSLSEKTKSDILQSCKENSGGVRELKRQIQKKIKDQIAKQTKKTALVI